MNRFLLALSVLPVALAAVAVDAAQPMELVSTVMVEKAVTVAGKVQVKLEKPGKILPEDKLIFQTSYHNGDSRPVTKFALTNPIPAAVAWTGEATPGYEVSVDGGKTWGALAQLKVKGAAAMRPAQSGDVTTIRWTLAVVAPGATGAVKYRAMVR